MPARLDALLAHGWCLAPYVDLPEPHQKALARYLAAEGHGWARPLSTHEPALHRECARRFGQQQFGLVELPAQTLRQAVMSDPGIAADWPDWPSYHAWYLSQGVPSHATVDRWPVLLSSTDDETLVDGWHRLHCYLHQGACTVPALFFPAARHLAAAQRTTSA